MSIEKGKASHDIDSRAYRELEELILGSGQLAMSPESWAHWLAWEFCFLNEQPGHWVGMAQAEIQYMRVLEAHAVSLPLRQVPSCARWPAGVPLPPTWHVELVLVKSELREWAMKNCHDLLGRLLPGEDAGAHESSAAKTADGPKVESEKRLAIKHVTKLSLQKSAILKWLRKNDYNPQSLPERPQGKPGAKAKVSEAMLKNNSLFTESSFKKAWETLRREGSIQGGE